RNFQFNSPGGKVSVVFESVRSESMPDCPNPANLSTVMLTDRNGVRFRLSMSGAEAGMDMWCGDETSHSVERTLFLSELPEDQAVGLALNLPITPAKFGGAAALAMPLLRHYCP